MEEETPISNLHFVTVQLISSLCGVGLASLLNSSVLPTAPTALISSGYFAAWLGPAVCVLYLLSRAVTCTFDHSWIPTVRNTQQSHVMQGTELFGFLLL